MTRLHLLATFVLCACGGGSALTEIVVAVDTNLCLAGERTGQPAEYDRVDVEVRAEGTDGGTSVMTRCAVFGRNEPPCASNPERPWTLSVLRDRETVGVTVTVRGSLAGTDRAVRTVRADFVPNESRLLRVELTRSCIPPGCGPDQQSTFPRPATIEPFLGCTVSQPPPMPPFARIAAGTSHACLLDFDGTPYCWGAAAAVRRLEDDSCARRISGVTDVVEMALGGSHTCFLRAGGDVQCMGDGTVGQLGNGLLMSSDCCPAARRADDGATLNADVIAAGGLTSCALTGGQIRCFGQVGSYAPTRTSTATVVPMFATSLSALDIGADHLCALSGTSIECYGSNERGQLGRGMAMPGPPPPLQPPAAVTGTETWIAVATGARTTCGLAGSGGDVYCWGENRWPGTLGFPTAGMPTEPQATPRRVGTLQAAQIDAGDAFVCARSAMGVLSCWGEGDYGRLGDGNMEDSVEPVTVLGGPYRMVALGNQFACALPQDQNELPRCWGRNINGQLANGSAGDATNSATPATIRLCD